MADKDWDRLMTNWQSSPLTSGHQSQSVDELRELENKTRKKARRMKLFMWADIIGTVVATVAFLYLALFIDINIQQAVIFVGILFIIIPMGIYSVMVRRGLWEATGNDTYAYLELARKRAIAGIKLAQANMVAAWIAFPFIIAVVMWRASERADAISWPWNQYTGVIIFELLLFGGLYLGARYYRNKKQQEHQQLDDMLKQFHHTD
jgi:lysylphosphatidylglycerol synthetase-like protein (DUF2156 family)